MSVYSTGTLVNIMSHGYVTLLDGTDVSSTDTVRTKIRAAVVHSLQQITTANGYRTTIRGVYDPPKAWDAIPEYPSVNVLWDAERQQAQEVAGNDPLLDIEWMLHLDVLLEEMNDPVRAVDNVLADIQQRFGKQYYITGSDGARTAFNCIYDACSMWGTESARPNFGATVDVKVWYRIKLADPAVMA